MKLILGIVLSVVLVLGLTTNVQSETIPSWIKGVAEFWAEDKINDKEFVEALEFLIESNIIQVSDPRVEALEKENKELRQKMELFESEKIPQSETTDKIQLQEKDKLAYIITDRREYSLGDTIKVSGFIDRSILDEQYTIEKVGGTTTHYNINNIRFFVSSQPFSDYVLGCVRVTEYDLSNDANFELNKFYVDQDGNLIADNSYQKCFDEKGMFESTSAVVNEDYLIDDNYIIFVQINSKKQVDIPYSEPFSVR